MTRFHPVASCLVVVLAACGGGGGGGAGGGGGLTLVQASLADLDNVPLNGRLRLTFSGPLDPASVGHASIQIRAGEAFGRVVAGTFECNGAEVLFLPEIPQTCTFDEAVYGGLRPGTTYRVTIAGYPEEFRVRPQGSGPGLLETATFEFRTRSENDRELFVDPVPGQAPAILAVTPADGSEAVAVRDGNEVRIGFSENLDPCTIDEASVRIHVYETGDPRTRIDVGGGRASGFAPPFDSSEDPYSWGSEVPVRAWSPPQRVPSTIALHQDHQSTELVISPIGGRLPENALVVVELSLVILDFGGLRLHPATLSFTTENLPLHERVRVIEFEGETPILPEHTTADVDTARSPGRAQGWFVFSGDGDNGFDATSPARPLPCIGQTNDGIADDFDPTDDVRFDTGSSVNGCANEVDGSRAVVWEFDSFRLRSGRTLRFVGENPAILLVRGDVAIDAGATVLVRGTDRNGIPPVGGGGNSEFTFGATPAAWAKGGTGVAGGGSGGDSAWGVSARGADGVAGVGSSEERQVGGHGAGLGGVALVKKNGEFGNGGTGGGGGGGGHASTGEDGVSEDHPLGVLLGPHRSDGGTNYWAGVDGRRLLQASAGSGGGGGGWMDHEPAGSSAFAISGGAGGAGGGFLAIVCGGDCTIGGTIDAKGGKGGDGAALGWWNPGGGGSWMYVGRVGGGGGGAGGGILLLTPGDVRLSASAVLTATGGERGATNSAIPPPPYGHGGAGGCGRIVIEDGDSVVHGLTGATVVPGEGQKGFWRGVFDPTRFRGDRRCRVLSAPFFVGSLEPTYLPPAPSDLLSGVPAEGAPGRGRTAALLEVRGFPLLSSGQPDLSSPSDWYTAGFFEDTGVPSSPRWHAGEEPPDVPRASDSAGADLTRLNVPGRLPFLQVRLTFLLADEIGALDPGPYLDRWELRMEENL